jgi:spermidine/putrescine transport system substrate-binding protein
MVEGRSSQAFARLEARSALSRRGLVGAAAAAGGLAALGTVPGRPAQAATTMTWMGWQGYEVAIKHGSFLADNGIDFQPTFIASNEEILTRLQAGGDSTDLVTMYFGYLPLMAEAEMIRPIEPERVPLLPRLVPQFTSQPAIFHGGKLMGVPWNWGSLPLMYDPAVTPTPPASWMDVTKPEYRGKVAMVDDPLSALMVWGSVVTEAEQGTILTREQLKRVIDFLVELKTKHARAFFPSYGDMAEAFARDEVVISAVGWEAVAIWAAQKGKRIEYTIPKEGTGLFMDCLVIPSGAQQVDLTYKMINHVVSPEPQVAFATDQSAGITNLDAVPMLPEGLRASYQYGDLDAFLEKARLYPLPPTEYDGKIATYDDFLTEYQRLQKA